jgi:2-iminoacetate synthase
VFLDIFYRYDFQSSVNEVKSKNKQDVEFAISRSVNGERLDFQDYLALISPSADIYLEEMASTVRP